MKYWYFIINMFWYIYILIYLSNVIEICVLEVEQIVNGKLFGKGVDTYNGQNIKLESPTLQWTTQFMTLLIIQLILTSIYLETVLDT